MSALPFVTEQIQRNRSSSSSSSSSSNSAGEAGSGSRGFRGKIFATEPTKLLGRRYLEELAKNVEALSSTVSPFVPAKVQDLSEIEASLDAGSSRSGHPGDDDDGGNKWKALKKLYTVEEIRSCTSKIQTINYLEEIVRRSHRSIQTNSGRQASKQTIKQTKYNRTFFQISKSFRRAAGTRSALAIGSSRPNSRRSCSFPRPA